MARLPKNSRAKGPRKNETNVTAVIVVLLAVVVGLILFLNKEKKSPVAKTTVSPKVKVVAKQRQVPLPPVTGVVLPVKPKAIVKKAKAGSAGRIAFVLDDWGENVRNCKYLKEIPDPLAIAILPELPSSDKVAKCAGLYNKLIMLHLPMEAVHNKDPYPTDYLLKTTMKASKIEKILNGYLAKMPYVEGVNNHMGSKATEDRALMRVVFKNLKKKGLFFMDSMTALDYSKGRDVAEEVHLPFAQRDVFLDNINSHDEIVKQLEALKLKSRKKGYAIAIGHDRELTLKVLKEQIPLLKEEGFDIVSVKDLLKTK